MMLEAAPVKIGIPGAAVKTGRLEFPAAFALDTAGDVTKVVSAPDPTE